MPRRGRASKRRGRGLKAKVRSRTDGETGCAWLVGWHGILAWRVGLPAAGKAVRRAPRDVWPCAHGAPSCQTMNWFFKRNYLRKRKE